MVKRCAPSKAFAKQIGPDNVIICDDGTWWRTILYGKHKTISYTKLRSSSYDTSIEPPSPASDYIGVVKLGNPSGITKQKQYWIAVRMPCYRWDNCPAAYPHRDGHVSFWMRYRKSSGPRGTQETPSYPKISFSISQHHRTWTIDDLTISIKNQDYTNYFIS